MNKPNLRYPLKNCRLPFFKKDFRQGVYIVSWHYRYKTVNGQYVQTNYSYPEMSKAQLTLEIRKELNE